MDKNENIIDLQNKVIDRLRLLIDEDDFFRSCLEESIIKAYGTVSDSECNPIRNIDDYIKFISRALTSYPWEICSQHIYPSLYERINQGMGALYFVTDQPLDRLSEKDYYHNSLMYYPPFAEWFDLFLKVNGDFLDSPESWNEKCLEFALSQNDFHLKDGTYENPENWHTFNDFFARHLSSPGRRPVASGSKNVVMPADAIVYGVWDIDDQGNVLMGGDEGIIDELQIKTGQYRRIEDLLANDQYSRDFYGGKMIHMMLDINDYHRYHFPVSGEIIEIKKIEGITAPGGVMKWDENRHLYVEYLSESFSWQAIETRGLILVDTGDHGKVAILPVGMCQVSSVYIEPQLSVGIHVEKGDPLGCFYFGGSDIVIVFEKKADFEPVTELKKHMLAGECVGKFNN